MVKGGKGSGIVLRKDKLWSYFSHGSPIAEEAELKLGLGEGDRVWLLRIRVMYFCTY